MNQAITPPMDPVPEAPHWAEDITNRQTCANCAVPRVGKFCPHCGQKHLFERLRLRELTRDLLFRLTSFEAGLFHTWWNLCRRPGQVARDYVSGKQRPYVNPLTCFFLAATLQLLAFWNVTPILRSQMQAQFAAQLATSPNQDALQRAEELLGEPMSDALVGSYLTAAAQGYTYAALLFFVLPFGFMLWLLHGVIGERFRFGETLVFALFIFSLMLFYTAVCTPLTARIHPALHMAMAIGVYLVIPQVAHGHFFRRTWLSRLMTGIATMIAWCPFIVSLLGLFLASFFFKLIWAARFAA